MTRYYCDVCHKEIEGWYHEVKISLQATGRKRNQKKAKLHFHDECLAKFMEALEEKEKEKEEQK